MKAIICSVLLTAASALCVQATPVPTIQVISPNAVGQPGTTVGWGFTLTYTDPADWVVLNDSFFTGSQVYGTYKDYIATYEANQQIVAGPAPESSSVTVPYSQAMTGLGEYDINPTALPDALITGNIVVDYTIFSQDPNSPTFDPGSYVSSGQASAAVTINITPEPQSFGLILVAALLALWLHRRRAGSKPPCKPRMQGV